MWPTPTKPGRPAPGLRLLAYAERLPAARPWFAIGGIDLGNLDEVLAAGARRVVMVRAITGGAGSGAAAGGQRPAAATGGQRQAAATGGSDRGSDRRQRPAAATGGATGVTLCHGLARPSRGRVPA